MILETNFDRFYSKNDVKKCKETINKISHFFFYSTAYFMQSTSASKRIIRAQEKCFERSNDKKSNKYNTQTTYGTQQRLCRLDVNANGNVICALFIHIWIFAVLILRISAYENRQGSTLFKLIRIRRLFSFWFFIRVPP